MQKIAIIGPESTGKTTLARQLGDYFAEPWVREYAREYLEGLNRPYEEHDLLSIAHGQLRQEARAVKAAESYLFCDTNLLVIKIWAQDKFHRVDPEILSLWEPEDYYLHLLLYPDLDWEPDPLREDPNRLLTLFEKYEHELERAGVSYAVIKGQGEERFQQALWALEV
ncbi:MAG: ATP-binding protein [Bacteroidia bacterium]|nr:ATP-binding protein [Bacteroidia bacterium]